MAVQGIDVTGWDCIKVKEFLQSQKGRVHLVLRSPVLRNKQTMNITIEKCEVKHFEELGLSLHLIVKVKPGSQAEQFGFNEFDEVIQVKLSCLCRYATFYATFLPRWNLIPGLTHPCQKDRNKVSFRDEHFIARWNFSMSMFLLNFWRIKKDIIGHFYKRWSLKNIIYFLCKVYKRLNFPLFYPYCKVFCIVMNAIN